MMPFKIGDVVTVKSNEVEIVQLSSFPVFHSPVEPLKVAVKKGILFEIKYICDETNAARIEPLNCWHSEEFIIIVELSQLLKCGKGVEVLYTRKKH